MMPDDEYENLDDADEVEVTTITDDPLLDEPELTDNDILDEADDNMVELDEVELEVQDLIELLINEDNDEWEYKVI